MNKKFLELVKRQAVLAAKSAQDKLVTFLFQQQVELRRKGLI